MSEPSAPEVVRAYVDAVQTARQRQRVDEAWRAVAALLASEVQWRFAGSGADRLWPVELSGRDAVLARLRDPAASWSRLRTDTSTLLGCGGPVVLVEQVSTIVGSDGEEVVKPVAHVFTVSDGVICEVRTYRNDAPPG